MTSTSRTLVRLACLPLSFAFGFGHVPTRTKGFPRCPCLLSSESTAGIDYQADYGRGVHHLTSELQEGDVAVFQEGTWYVDGVAVGDGTPASWVYCLVDTVQIVWSHNCEHGVVRGFVLEAVDDSCLTVRDYETMVDFGPEQLVARIPTKPTDRADTFHSLVPLSDALWEEQDVT